MAPPSPGGAAPARGSPAVAALRLVLDGLIVRSVVQQRGLAVPRVGIGDFVLQTRVVAIHVVRVPRILEVELVGRGLAFGAAAGATALERKPPALLVRHGRE